MFNRKVFRLHLVDRQIEDARNAVESGNLLSALALALTLPDVFGQVLYPNMLLSNGRRNAGAQ